MGKEVFAVVCLVVVVLASVRGSAEGTTIHVGLGGGYDYDNIQDGIDAASEGDTVLVHDGEYTGPGNRNLNLGGRAITIRSVNGAASTTINCQSVSRAFMFSSGETTASKVIGFTIRNGQADGGGAMKCLGSSPTIAGCVIMASSANDIGGGILCDQNSNPEITDCTISGNSVGISSGGGIYCHVNSSPIIKNCTISDNVAQGNGGGICCYDESSPQIINCIINGNTANGHDGGGGLFAWTNSDPVITHCTIAGNTAQHYGGGVYSYYGSNVTVTNSILWGNTADEDGDEITVRSVDHPSALTVTYCDVEGGEGNACVDSLCSLEWGEGNIDADPLFEDGYHLGVGSPCIDAGCDAGVYTDIEGNVRPFGSGFDMGAYEAIPEPSVLVLMAFGVLGLLVRRREK